MAKYAPPDQPITKKPKNNKNSAKTVKTIKL